MSFCLQQSVDYGKMAEILVQRAASPDEFTRLTSFTWVFHVLVFHFKLPDGLCIIFRGCFVIQYSRISVLLVASHIIYVWQLNEFVKLSGEQLVPYYSDILGAILPAISDKEEKIRVVCFLYFALSSMILLDFAFRCSAP